MKKINELKEILEYYSKYYPSSKNKEINEINEIIKNEKGNIEKYLKDYDEKKVLELEKKERNLTKSITDNFLVRLEKYKKEQIEREKNLKKIILKNEEDKINKNNYLIITKKINKKRMNNSFDKINNSEVITKSINKLFDWDKKRKEKIQKEIKKQALIEKNRWSINKN